MNTQTQEVEAFKLIQSVFNASSVSGPYQDEEREEILSTFNKATKVGISGLFTITELNDGSKILTETLGSDVEITYAPSYSYDNKKFFMNKSSLTNIHEVLKSLPRGNFSDMVSF